MTNAIAKTNGSAKGGALVHLDQSKLDALARNMTHGATARVGFLKMGKDGSWCYGTNEVPVDDDERLYIDPTGFIHGWQCWADTTKVIDGKKVESELLGTETASMFDPLPEKPAKTPEKAREWAELKGLSCILDGQPLVYSTTSVGGRNAIAALAQQYIAQYRADATRMIAVVTLSCDSYKHKDKTFGRIYTPVFTVVEWVGHLPEVIASQPQEHDVPLPSPSKKTPAKKAAPNKAPPIKAPNKPAKKNV